MRRQNPLMRAKFNEAASRSLAKARATAEGRAKDNEQKRKRKANEYARLRATPEGQEKIKARKRKQNAKATTKAKTKAANHVKYQTKIKPTAERVAANFAALPDYEARCRYAYYLMVAADMRGGSRLAQIIGHPTADDWLADHDGENVYQRLTLAEIEDIVLLVNLSKAAAAEAATAAAA